MFSLSCLSIVINILCNFFVWKFFQVILIGSHYERNECFLEKTRYLDFCGFFFSVLKLVYLKLVC